MISPITPMNSLMANVLKTLKQVSDRPQDKNRNSIHTLLNAAKHIQETGHKQNEVVENTDDGIAPLSEEDLAMLLELCPKKDTSYIDTFVTDDTTETGIIVDFGNEPTQVPDIKFLTYGPDGFLKLPKGQENFFSHDVHASRKNGNFDQILKDALEYDRLATDPESVRRHDFEYQGNYLDSSLEHLIYDTVKDKTLNEYYAKSLAEDITSLIKSITYSDSGNNEGYSVSAEQAAVERATGLKLAEYLAENFIDDPDKASVFLNKVQDTVEESEMIGKGYFIYKETAVPDYTEVKKSIVPQISLHAVLKLDRGLFFPTSNIAPKIEKSGILWLLARSKITKITLPI